MAAPQLFTIVDDSCSDSFVFGPLEWTRTGSPEEFNSTSQTPAFALDQAPPLGNVTMQFNGTSVAFFGNTPAAAGIPRTFSVSIDGDGPYFETYSDPNPPTYQQWYQSPLLEEGYHSIILSNIAGDASVDFAVVTVGEDTPLNGTLIIADNDDLGFNYTGKWSRSQHLFIPGYQKPDGFPYHNSTHQTSEVGSSLTYQFTGISMAVYGVFTWSNLGIMTLTFTLDGQSLSETYDVRPDTSQFISGLGQQQNFLFYEYSFLQAGSHTLVVNVTECVNQTFAFDYVTYTPSFATLATMPNSTVAIETEQKMSKNSHAGGVAAGLGAAVIVLLLVAIFFFFGRRRQKARARKYKAGVYPFQYERNPNKLTSVFINHGQLPQTPPVNRSDYSPASPPPGRALAPLRPVRLQPSDDVNAPLISSIVNPTDITDAIPLSGATDATSARRNMRKDTVGTLPPSYDETTKGRPPTQMAYLFRR